MPQKSYMARIHGNDLLVINRDPIAALSYDVLSERETKVVGSVMNGLNTHAIARTFGIPSSVVSSQVDDIYQKLGISSRGELASLLRHQKPN